MTIQITNENGVCKVAVLSEKEEGLGDRAYKIVATGRGSNKHEAVGNCIEILKEVRNQAAIAIGKVEAL